MGCSAGRSSSDGDTDTDTDTDSDTDSDTDTDTDTESASDTDSDSVSDSDSDCGNGVLDGTEECDDGDRNDATGGCDSRCEIVGVCGNGIVEAWSDVGPETCDDGNAIDDANGCDAACAIMGSCGNGVREDWSADGPEACDGGTGCSVDCEIVGVCGNGRLEVWSDVGVEACDDGNAADDGNGCGAACDVVGSCGNGRVEEWSDVGAEECDDGAHEVGDGCDDVCAQEAGVPPVPNDLVLNEAHGDPNATDVNCDGVGDTVDDEFIEVVNVSGRVLDLTAVEYHDAFGLRYTFAAGTILPADGVLVLFGDVGADGFDFTGGCPALSWPGVTTIAAGGSGVSLNNGGDTLSFEDAGGVVLFTEVLPAFPDGRSWTLSPDLDDAGGYVDHGSVSALDDSPGARTDGTVF